MSEVKVKLKGITVGGTVKFQPKGNRCLICVDKDKDCTRLEFELMPVIDTELEGDNVLMFVKCRKFKSLQ